MKRRIHIILLQHDAGWANLLNQTGASWSTGINGNTAATDASCIIINRKPLGEETEAAKQFTMDGGTVIDTSGELYGETTKPVRISQLKPFLHNGELTGCAGTIYLRERTSVVSDKSFLDGAVAFKPSNNVVFWGIDPGQFFKGFEKSQHTFPHSTLPSVSERTARCGSGEISNLFLLTLVRLHRDAGMPFIRKWKNKESTKIPATFRVDYDFGLDEHVQPLANMLKNCSVPATWFLHMDALTDNAKEVLDQNTAFEFALHCNRHIEFKKADDYQADIRNGLDQLKEINIIPEGYAAPYGNWSAALRQAIESFEFSYSSEFCYDYDSEPSIPYDSKTVQVPVHPVSIGTLNRFKFGRQMISRYLEEIIDLKMFRFDSLNLYHHPNDQHTDLLENAFNYAEAKGFRFMSYTEFAENWNEIINRDAFFYFKDDEIELNYPFYTAIHSDQTITVTGEKQISLNELDFVSFADKSTTDLIKKREQNQTLSVLKRLKYGFLAWRWRKKA